MSSGFPNHVNFEGMPENLRRYFLQMERANDKLLQRVSTLEARCQEQTRQIETLRREKAKAT